MQNLKYRDHVKAVCSNILSDMLYVKYHVCKGCVYTYFKIMT